ncbi:MAG TPA: protein kinase [Vicinamibacterales bacterium]|nr:protein kinase [Vicinamibacterales bacterium]
MSLSPGISLGPYEIIAPLGGGGMGEVYRALDSALGREVAIKVLHEELGRHPERLARFSREARLLASLTHPNIAVVHGLERSEDLSYLVMELVRGETLHERITRGRIGLREALGFFKQIAEALEVAHAQGMVHRDLKPANIMVTPQGTVKILDFGLAKMVASEDSAQTQSPTLGSAPTAVGTIVGTAAYMSPEQARGDPVDRRTDIWAFGCLLFESLTGRRAFQGRTVSDVIAAVLREEPDWSLLAASATPNLQQLVRRCLQKNAHLRLHDIADARIEIDETLAQLSASTTPSALLGITPPARAWPGVRMLAAGAALVTLGAVAGIVGWRLASPVPRLPSLARLTVTLPASQTLERGRFPPAAISPDGNQLVYVATVNGGRTQLYLRSLDDLEARVIPGTEGAITPFFSSDGLWLAFYADGLLKKVSLAGGLPLTIAPTSPVWSASWRSERITFATTENSSGLWVVSANGGEPAPLTELAKGDSQHGYPQILGDGKQLLFSVRRADGWHLATTTLDGGDWRLLGNGRIIGEGAQYLPTGHLVYAQAAGLVVTPFDPSRGSLNDSPAPLLERLATSRFGGTYFAIAAEAGTLVYVPATGSPGDRTLLRVARDGRVAPLFDSRGAYEHPVLSPDARRVALTIATSTGSDIWLVDLDRGTRTRFTSGDTSASPVWGPDGDRVAFQSTAPGPWNLYWMPLDGTAEARPLFGNIDSAVSGSRPGESLLPGTLPVLSGAGPQLPVSWIRDGSAVAFHERKPNGERDIWIVTPGGVPWPFLLTPFDEHLPRFSPDGKWLAYVSDESGRNEIYVQPFPGPGRKWLVSTSGGTDPVWSRSSNELFYRQGDQMMVASVAPTGVAFSSAPPRPLFQVGFDVGNDGPSYDVSPDGQWFLMTRGSQVQPPAQLDIVLGWLNQVTGRTSQRTRISATPAESLALREVRR